MGVTILLNDDEKLLKSLLNENNNFTLFEDSNTLINNLNSEENSLDGIITPTDVVIFGELSSNTPNVFAQLQMNTGETTSNYNYLYNKPSIEGVTLVGDKTFEELNLVPLSNADLARILT